MTEPCMQETTEQTEACLFLRQKDPFSSYSQCFNCSRRSIRGGVSRMRKSTRDIVRNECAFKGRRFLADNVLQFCSGENQDPVYPRATTWTRLPTATEAEQMLRQIAEYLQPILEAEEAHIEHDDVVWFRRELFERVTCDRCRATLFASATLCTDCGREWCPDCVAEGAMCLPDHKSKLRRVCRFASSTELRATVAQMKEIQGRKLSRPHPKAQNHRRIVTLKSPTTGSDNWNTWMAHLRNGVPLVVSGCTESMARPYDFDYFAEALRGHKIKVVHISEPGKEVQKDAHSFFKSIAAGDPEAAKWKIKDFPPRHAFDAFLGSLAEDLDRCWPFQEYVSKTGALNLMSRSPINEGIPKSDVGPKMYISPGIPVELKKASTALHMDIMDAINVSLSSDEKVPVEQRVAVWYIFPHDKVDILRDYLNNKYKDDPMVPEGDIIHSGWVVFDEDMLTDLMRKTYLQPWIIHQRPGDMVFVPAYCPHMVRNLEWTLKSAIDFLSGAALSRTARVAQELRKHRFLDKNLDDVLQLPLVLWHAWVSINREMDTIRKAEMERRRAERPGPDSEEYRASKARRSTHGGGRR